MALVTVQRSPSPTNTPDSEETGEGGDEVDDPDLKSPGRQRRSKSTLKRLRKFFHTVRFISKLRPCFSESYFAVKGAALILPQSDSECTYSITKKLSKNSNEGDIQSHLQSMFYLLRPQDTIKVAVKLESSVNPDRNRYMAVVSTNGKQDTEESVILGIDCDEKATIGLVIPIYATTLIKLDGDGGFQISEEGCEHGFKPVSVQAMWSALQSLNKVIKIAEDNKYLPRGLTHTWVGYYKSKINSNRAYITEWNTNEDRDFFRSEPIVLETDDEEAALKKKIRVELKNVMMKVDLDDVTSRFLRESVEEAMKMDLKEHKGYIDKEMLDILGQMDSPTLIKDFLYLGSKWNASNMDELHQNGVGYIMNISKEIDNFFPGMFIYMNIREWDCEETDLLPYWEDTYKFISEARANNSKVLVHCKMGISRSASTVIAYCMKEYDMSRQDAYEYVRNLRSCIMPNSAFWAQLETYEGILKASNQRRIFKVRSEQNMQKSQSQPSVKTGTDIPEETGDFLGHNLPLFNYSHICHSTSDLEESVFYPDKRSEDDGNNCPLEPDFDNASRSADSTEELLPDNLSPTPDMTSGLIKTASGIYFFKDPIEDKESDESGDEGACTDNKTKGSDSVSDKHLLDSDSTRGSGSKEVPSLFVPKIKPDSSWIRESSTDDLEPTEEDKLENVPENDSTDAQTDESEGMIFFKAEPSEQVLDRNDITGTVCLQDATVTESSTDGDQPEIIQYIKENIPWNPGKVKKQKQDLEGKLSGEGSEGIVLLVEGVPYQENLKDKQNVDISCDSKSNEKDLSEDDKVIDKKEQDQKVVSTELVPDESESTLKRPASVYEIEDIPLPEGIVKRTTQEIEDRSRSTDDLTRSPHKSLRRSSSFKDQRVTPKNKRFDERRKTCTPILSPTTPSTESSPTKDISKSELESSFLRDTTPKQTSVQTVDCNDKENTQSICDSKDSDTIRDNQDLESPSADVAVYKFMGEEVSVEKGIVKKQKMDIEQKSRERKESEGKEMGTASTTSDTKTAGSPSENVQPETPSALQSQKTTPISGEEKTVIQSENTDSVLGDKQYSPKSESIKSDDGPSKSDSKTVSKKKEKSGENLDSPSGEYSGQFTPHIPRKKRKSESEKTGRFDAETLELIREIGSALLNSPAKSETENDEPESQEGGGLVRRFVKDIEKRTKSLHKKPSREIIIVEKDSQKKKQWRFSTPESHDSSPTSCQSSVTAKSTPESAPNFNMSHSVSTPAIASKSPIEQLDVSQDQKYRVPDSNSATGLPPLEKISHSKSENSHYSDTQSQKAITSPSVEGKTLGSPELAEDTTETEGLKGVKSLVGKFEGSDKPISTKYSVLSPSDENRSILDLSPKENIEIISASTSKESEGDKAPKVLSPTGHNHPHTGKHFPHASYQYGHAGHKHLHSGHKYPPAGHSNTAHQNPQLSDDQSSWEDITSDSSTEGTAHLRHLRQNLRKISAGTRPKSTEHLHRRSSSPGYHRYHGSDLRRYKFQHSRTVSDYSDSGPSFTWEGKKIRKLHGKSHPLTKLESKRKSPFYNTM